VTKQTSAPGTPLPSNVIDLAAERAQRRPSEPQPTPPALGVLPRLYFAQDPETQAVFAFYRDPKTGSIITCDRVVQAVAA
jgi:hypothetical protein